MKKLFRRTKKPRIGLDFDGTLLPTYEAIAEWSDKTFGTSFAPFQAKRWPDHWMRKVWGANAAMKSRRFDRSLDEEGYAPIFGSQAAVKALSKYAEIIVVTSGSVTQRGIKRRWLKKHFPGIKRIIFIDDKSRYPTKSDACRALGLSLIVEDRYDYALECAEAGYPAIILERYEWSHGPKHDRITFTKDWAQAEAAALSIIQS